MEPASNAKTTIDWVHRILKNESDIVITSPPLEASGFQIENIRIAYVFYESGLSINVMYTVDDPKGRAVGPCWDGTATRMRRPSTGAFTHA